MSTRTRRTATLAALFACFAALTSGCSASSVATNHSAATATTSASTSAIPSSEPEQTLGASQPFRTVSAAASDSGATRPALPDGRQRVQSFTVPTAKGHAWPVRVVLPEGYFDAANAHRTYPVITFAHGVPGSNAVWFGRLDIERLFDPLVTQHKIQPFIAVIPDVTSGGDSECILGPDGDTETEQWLTDAVPAFIKSRLRAMGQREGWAMAGYSAGGWCSAAIPILHPDVYSAGIVLSGYFTPWWGALKPAWSSTSAQAQRLQLGNTMRSTHPKIALFIESARDDTESWPSTKAFLGEVTAPTSVTTLIYPSGGHSFTLWAAALPRGVAWLGQQVPGFRP